MSTLHLSKVIFFYWHLGYFHFPQRHLFTVILVISYPDICLLLFHVQPFNIKPYTLCQLLSIEYVFYSSTYHNPTAKTTLKLNIDLLATHLRQNYFKQGKGTLDRMTTDKMTSYLIIYKSTLGNGGSWVNKALNFVTEWLQAWGSELTLRQEYNGIEKIPSFSPPFSLLRVYPGPQAYNNSVLKLSALPTQLSPLSK